MPPSWLVSLSGSYLCKLWLNGSKGSVAESSSLRAFCDQNSDPQKVTTKRDPPGGGDPQMWGDWLDLVNAQSRADNGRHSNRERYGSDAPALRASFLKPCGEVFVAEKVATELVVGREQGGVACFAESAAVEQDAGSLTGSSYQTSQSLVYLLHAGDLIDLSKSGVLALGLQDVHARALHGVDLWKRGSDDHGVRHAAAEQVDALREAGTQHEKEGVRKQEGFLNPGGLFSQILPARLQGNADRSAWAAEQFGNRLRIAVAREEDDDC